MTTTPFILNATEFDTLLATESVVVVDCTASWCGPCKMVAPLMDKLLAEYGDRARVYKLDLDANKEIAQRFKIRSIPSVMYFHKGELVANIVGVKAYADFVQELEPLLEPAG